MTIDMLDCFQHVPLNAKKGHSQFLRCFFICVAIDAAHQKDLQRTRFQLLKDYIEMFKLLATDKFAMLIIGGWRLHTLVQGN